MSGLRGLSRVCSAGLLLAVALGVLPAHGATVEYLHTDALGSIVAVTNSAGQVVERREYEPYGRQLTPAAPEDGPGYTGHVFDAATGLDYMQQRYYDPFLGRFLSVDPVTAYSTGDMRLLNRYAYAVNNPQRFNDPNGRAPKSICESNIKRCSSIIQVGPATMRDGDGSSKIGSESRGDKISFHSASGASYELFQPSTAEPKNEEGWIFESDIGNGQNDSPTYTGSVAWGLGIKGQKKSGPGNDRVAFVAAGAGMQATATWSLLKAGYDFGGASPKQAVDVAFLSGKAGAGLVGGFEIRYQPPGRIYVEFTAGFGAAAQADIWNIGWSPGVQP